MIIRVCTPSYKRPYGVSTFNYLPFVRVYVANEEYGAYKKGNPGMILVKCPDGIQGNVSRVRNYILDSEFREGADAVCIMDDDMKALYYWQGNKKHLLEPDRFLPFIERYSLLAREWGAYLWGVNLNQDKQIYREQTPFSTVSPVLGPFGVFLKGNECRYDERLLLKEDYDMSLQQINRYRVLLRVNKYFYICKQSEQKGGCASYRNILKEKAQIELLQKKWGSDIIRIDRNQRSHNLRKKKAVDDYNPLINVPIRGA